MQDANRRDREKELSSALVAQISQSPYARAAHRSSLSTLSSPAPLLSAFMSSSVGTASPGAQAVARLSQSLDRTGNSSFVAPPRSPAAAGSSAPSLQLGARTGTWDQGLPGTYQRPGRVENQGATYLTYLVEERKQQHWEARPNAEQGDDELDVDLEELSRQAAIDEASLRGKPLALPPAAPAPVPTANIEAGVGSATTAAELVASEPPQETLWLRDPAPQPAPEPEPASAQADDSSISRLLASLADGNTNLGSAAAVEAEPAQHRPAPEIGPSTISPELSTFHPVTDAEPAPVGAEAAQPSVLGLVPQPEATRGSYSDLAKMRQRTPSPVPDDDDTADEEIGGQWRRQFGLSPTAVAESEDGGGQIVATEDGQIVASFEATEFDQSEAKKRLDRLRGGGRGGVLSRTPPSRGSSRSNSPLPSASPSRDDDAQSPEAGAQDLLRRIERHTTINGHVDQHEISKMFDAMDANSNGFLTESELRMGLEKTMLSKPTGGTSLLFLAFPCFSLTLSLLYPYSSLHFLTLSLLFAYMYLFPCLSLTVSS